MMTQQIVLAKKYASAVAILLIGLAFLAYGIATAPTTDDSAVIFQRYDCNRATADARSTDIYCQDPKSASGYSSTKHYLDKWTKVSGVFVLLGLADYAYLYKLNRRIIK